MKFKLIIIGLVAFFLSCVQNQKSIVGNWKITKVIEPKKNPLPPRPNDFKNSIGRYVEFKSDSTVATDLFHSNFGQKIYEYFPDLDMLKIKQVGITDATMSSTGEWIVYEGRLTQIDDNVLKWELSDGSILIFEK